MSPERLRQLMANDVELSDIIFKALIARRELLQRSTAAQAVEIVAPTGRRRRWRCGLTPPGNA